MKLFNTLLLKRFNKPVVVNRRNTMKTLSVIGFLVASLTSAGYATNAVAQTYITVPNTFSVPLITRPNLGGGWIGKPYLPQPNLGGGWLAKPYFPQPNFNELFRRHSGGLGRSTPNNSGSLFTPRIKRDLFDGWSGQTRRSRPGEIADLVHRNHQ